MRQLLVIMLIGLLIMLPSCKYFKGGGIFGNKSKSMAIMKVREDSIRVADSLQKVKDRLAVTENTKPGSENKGDEERSGQKAGNKFNIIVGSFITPEYAKVLMEVYRKRGFDPKILKPDRSKFELVSIEGYDSFQKAVSRLKQFQDTIQLEAWLYIKK
jgi:hypothetical protein